MVFGLNFSLVTSRRVEGKSIFMNFYDFSHMRYQKKAALGNDKSQELPSAVIHK
jgi:hypothetical protein